LKNKKVCIDGWVKGWIEENRRMSFGKVNNLNPSPHLSPQLATRQARLYFILTEKISITVTVQEPQDKGY
jgi:hypothetical protein